MELNINFKLRPCKANGKNALFHKWSERSARGARGGVIKYTVGIVEYEDGNIGEVSPATVQFLDTNFKEIYFGPGNK